MSFGPIHCLWKAGLWKGPRQGKKSENFPGSGRKREPSEPKRKMTADKVVTGKQWKFEAKTRKKGG